MEDITKHNKECEDKYHITLLFLGDTTAQNTKMLAKRLRTIKQDKISCNFKGIDVFPNKNYIKTIYAKAIGKKYFTYIEGLKKTS